MTAAYYNEIDPHKAEWLRELMKEGLIANGDIDTRSIADVRPDDLRPYIQCHFFAGIGIWSYALRLAGWPDDRECWTGSCPCQPFSAAGQRIGFSDPRHLWPDWFRLIAERRPPVVFGEQVASAFVIGAVSRKSRSNSGPVWFDTLCDDLEAVHYACGAVSFPACSVGAPHIRQRLYWVGMAHTPIVGHDGRRSGEAFGRQVEPERLRDAGGLEHTEEVGRRWRQDDNDGWGRECALADRGATNGFWRGSDWVLTRPQRVGDRPGLRPVKPGTFPLAHGFTGRVPLLRGAGDGIVAPQAAAFIQSYMSVRP